MATAPTGRGQDARAGRGTERDEVLDGILREFQGPLLRYATRILRDSSAAEDIVQNTFIKLCERWMPGSRKSTQLRAWLFRVVHNGAVDLMRRESRRRRLHREHAAGLQMRIAATLAQDRKSAELHEQILEQLARLEPKEQQVLLLRLEENMSYKEISLVTGRSVGNVGCILHHAARNLADRLRKAGLVVRGRAATGGKPRDSEPATPQRIPDLDGADLSAMPAPVRGNPK